MNAVAVCDGETWRLYADGAAVEGAEAVRGGADRFPSELAAEAARIGARRVAVVAPGSVFRVDGAVPKSMSLNEANAVMREAIAEETGADADGFLVAGVTSAWPGVRRPFTLTGATDGAFADDCHAALADAGVVCGGFASLELAIYAVWREAVFGEGKELPGLRNSELRPSKNCTLLVIGDGHSFVVPPPRGANDGPRSAACGLRHMEADSAAWVTRLGRIISGIPKESHVHVLVPRVGKGAAAVRLLRRSGKEMVVEEPAEAWLAAAAGGVTAAKPNRLVERGVPLANPYEPRKKFSNWWIAAAAAIVLAAPVVFRWACEASANSRCASIERECARYMPLKNRTEQAKKDLRKAQSCLAAEKAEQSARIEQRRPLVAFIDVAYFFCRNSGRTVQLESIEESGAQVEVRGTFTDPEDGVMLSNGFLEYAKAKGIEIVKNDRLSCEGAEAGFLSRFTIVADCSRVGAGKEAR